MKVLLAVPTFETIFPDTFKAIYDLDVSGHEVSFEFVRGYDCAKARNTIAQMAIDKGFDYVLMVDNDVIMPKDALQNLIQGENDVCFGFCAHRGEKNLYDGRTTICRLYDEKGIKYFDYTKESMYTGQEMHTFYDEGTHKVQIHGGGTACVLIKTDVFKRLKFPWFNWVEYSKTKQISEDLYFCEQCKKAKIPLYVDTRVECGHIFRHIQQAD